MKNRIALIMINWIPEGLKGVPMDGDTGERVIIPRVSYNYQDLSDEWVRFLQDPVQDNYPGWDTLPSPSNIENLIDLEIALFCSMDPTVVGENLPEDQKQSLIAMAVGQWRKRCMLVVA